MKAARKALSNYITQNYAGSTNRFAIENGFNQSEVSKLLRGARKSITVQYAALIDQATGGRVPIELWVEKGKGA